MVAADTPHPGLVAGLGRAGATAGVSEIKREEKEDEENASVADAEEDKKDLKAPRTRTRCQTPPPGPRTHHTPHAENTLKQQKKPNLERSGGAIKKQIKRVGG